MDEASIQLRTRAEVSRLDEYVAGLPNGFDSYPDHGIKAAFLRGVLETLPGPLDRDRVPEPLRHWIDLPPPPSVLVPAVQTLAFNLIARDQFFDDAEYITWMADMNRAVLNSRLYRALFLFVKPATVINQSASRWRAVHRGIELTSRTTGSHSYEVELRYPRGLVHPLFLLNWRDSFVIGTEAAGAKSPCCRVESWNETRARYVGGWS